MDIITYVIPGDPTPWKRAAPNHIQRLMYDTQKKIKLAHGLLIKSQHKNRPKYVGALMLDLTCYIKIPRSTLAKQKALIGKPVPVKPDCDNYSGYLKDMCNGILYKDDGQIAYESIRKIYDLNPRTEFTIVEIQ